MKNPNYILTSLPAFLKKKQNLILLAIILLAIFFRTYRFVDFFEYGHDGDLYSWVVKDVVVNKHLRLIGQETSTPGIFIGPIFYYLLIPFFVLASMDPIGTLYLVALLSSATVVSFYFIFKKLFDETTGFIAAFLQSALLVRVTTERWVVPTITTNLWVIWYLYVVLMLAKGKFIVLPLLGFLVGLIWHINFALAPVLLAIIPAVFLSRKMPEKKLVIGGLLGFAVPMIPYFLFEARHGFSQTKAFIYSFIVDQGGRRGWDKLNHVLQEVVGNTVSVFFYPYRDIIIPGIWFLGICLISGFFLIRKGGLDGKALTVLYTWVGSVLLFFTFSSKIISEYYFSNLETVFLSIFIVGLSLCYKSSTLGKRGVLALLAGFAIWGLVYINGDMGYSQRGYRERKAVASYIAQDSREKQYPCVSVSYITSPGNNVGLRYFFYLNGLHVNQPSSGSPNYTIVFPLKLAENDVKINFGGVGIIPPRTNSDLQEVIRSCSGENSNLTDPLFGFTQ